MINNIELLAFIRDNLAFARTIVIKNEKLAIADNALMKAYYGLDSGDDKTKWRYYLNLNGEYHSTDTMMQVKSLDDNELINFTKANLEQHPATKKAYRLGGYYFSRLNTQYPGQSELIQGIINPISPEESIAANDFQILRYTKEYINWNETQLIPALQDDIYKNVYQFYDTEYLYTDNLMAPALVAIIEKCVFEFLLECRFENRKTRFAHSFYIWSYLQSKGISPIYKDLLNAKQTMWLFRNIDYVLRNLGKTKTFEQLIDILLTERNIPLTKYDLILSTEEMRDTLKPEPLYFSRRLNLIAKKGTGEALHKVSKIMLKENPESLDNDENYDLFLSKTRAESTFGKMANYPIKVLDSDLVDTTNRKPETIYSVLNNELIYLAGKGLYNINLDIEEPRTGIHHRISVKDAIVLWHHLLNKYHGADCDKIPSFYYQKVLKVVPPKLSELLATGSKPFTTEEWCKDVLKTYIPQIRIVSPSIFYQNSLDILNLKWDHQKMYSRWLSIGYYSRRKNAISAMYETGFMKLTDKKTYTEFLEQFEFDFTNYSKEDYFRLMWAIWKKMTGWDQFTHITIAQIQSGMIGLMKFLSSYSVQYVYQTVMEEGWYEGGIDLFTENPMLLSPNTDGQSELETDTSRWLPVHHRVVTDEELEAYYFESGRFESWSMLADLTKRGEILQTPLLYDYDDDDDGGHDNVHDAYNIDMTNKYRNYTGSLPYDLEDLIPSGGSRANDHTLKEMIVDSFEGVVTVGPWTAKSIVIVDNHLDNKAVAADVDGFSYSKIVKTESFTKDGVAMNRYYVGFVPALLDSNTIKLDIIAENSAGEQVHVRFDYNIKTKQNTWAISFDIPESIRLNETFDITQVITGLSLNGETVVKESYVVGSDVSKYLTVSNASGKPVGSFIAAGWPDELPVMYMLQTKNTNSDAMLAAHYYYMKGLIPSDRYYDPLTDPEFDPTTMYNEADLYAITMERFSVTASHNGWEAVNLYVKKDSNGAVPTDKVKTDYNGITDFLTPKLSDTKYVDKTADGKTTRTFEWLYAIAKSGVSIPMVLELKSTNGTIVQKEFTYTPTVVDHGTQATYTISADNGYPFGVNLNNVSSLKVSGLKSTVTLAGAYALTRSSNSDSNITIAHTGTPAVTDNSIITGYIVTPLAEISKNGNWGVQVSARVKAANGSTLQVYPYGQILIKPEDVIDYDKLDESDIVISSWGDLPLYTHAMAGTRFAIDTLDNGWSLSAASLTKYNNTYHESIADSIPDHLGNVAFSGLSPTVVIGTSKDGNTTIPSGKSDWFTVKAIGNRKVLAEGSSVISLPITITVKNKFTNKTKTFNLKTDITFINTPFALIGDVKEPEKLNPGRTNHIVPEWDSLPFSRYGTATKVSSEGEFFGVLLYTGGTGYKEKPTFAWNSDDTADITFPAGPLTDGRGIRIYNKRIYRSTATAYAGSSLQDIVYYPFIDYAKSEINRIETPTLADFDFTAMPNPDFFKGVRSTAIALFNSQRIYDMGWKVLSVGVENIDEADYFITSLNDVNIKNNAYTTGTQTSNLHDMPSGKNKYATVYTGFIPAKEGTQKFAMLLTAACTKITGVEQQVYRYEFEVDVQPQEGLIDWDSSDPDPWWLIGKETFYLTNLTGVSGAVRSSLMLLGDVNAADSAYMSVRGAVNSALSGKKALAVTVKQTFSGITPKAVVGWSAFFNGYYTTDPRANRRYFGTLDIREDRLYNAEDINAAIMELEPDVVFPKMNQWESYTERYVYNVKTRGWTVSKMSYKDNYDWMNHCLTYDGYQRTNAQLGQNGTPNQSKDLRIASPDNKTFYLHTIGGFKVGTFTYDINVVLANKHVASSTTITFAYPRTVEIVKSDIAFKFEDPTLVIGETTTLEGKFVNVPSADLNDAVKSYSSTILPIGSNYGYFTAVLQPIRISVKDTYAGNGAGIMISNSVSYTGANSGKIVDSNTWYRRYRGDVVIPESNIVFDIANFDLKPMGVYFREMQSTPEFIFFNKSWNGWEVQGIRFKEGTEDEYVLKEYDGIDLTTLSWYSIDNSQTVAINSEKAYSRLRFVPKKAGQFTYPLELIIKKDGVVTYIPFTIDMEVKSRRDKIPHLIMWTSPDNKLVSETNPLTVNKNNSCRVYEDDIELEYVVYQSTNGIHTLSGYSNQYITISLGVKGTTGYTPATIKPLAIFSNDVTYYHIYDSSYSLDRYKDIYNPSTIKYVVVSELMETVIEKEWVVSA